MTSWSGTISFSVKKAIEINDWKAILRKLADFNPQPSSYFLPDQNATFFNVSFTLNAQNKLAADVQLTDLIDRLSKHLSDQAQRVISFDTYQLSDERTADAPAEPTKATSVYTFVVLFKDTRSMMVRAARFWDSSYSYVFESGSGERIAQLRRDEVESIVRADCLPGSMPGALSLPPRTNDA